MRSLTILSGTNSSGKSSFIQLPLLLKQTLEIDSAQHPLFLEGKIYPVRRYLDILKDKNKAEKKGSFENAAAESYHLNRLRELEEKAKKAKVEIEKINTKANSSENVKNLFRSIIGDNDLSVKSLTGEDLQISKYSPPNFVKLSDEQRKVVLEIFEILEDVLDFDMSELVKKRIVEKYN